MVLLRSVYSQSLQHNDNSPTPLTFINFMQRHDNIEYQTPSHGMSGIMHTCVKTRMTNLQYWYANTLSNLSSDSASDTNQARHAYTRTPYTMPMHFFPYLQSSFKTPRLHYWIERSVHGKVPMSLSARHPLFCLTTRRIGKCWRIECKGRRSWNVKASSDAATGRPRIRYIHSTSTWNPLDLIIGMIILVLSKSMIWLTSVT